MYGGSSNAGYVWIGSTNVATPMASYLNVMEQIHVLLVDNDPKALFDTGKMLEMCSYKVTHVDLASSAISMLSTNRHTKFDVVMASTDSPDRQSFKLLQLAVAMGIPIALLSVDEDVFFTSKAMQDGAFLNIQKPVPMVVIRFLWQNIMREKMQKILRDQRGINTGNNDFNVELMNHMNESFETEPFGRGGMTMNNVLQMDINNKGKEIITENIDGMNNEEYYGDVNHRVQRKSWTEWTDELHAKFVHAVKTLGEGRCFPKDILQLMNVPGLTRMQVASHLQKCRNETWRLTEEQKNQLVAIQSQSDSNCGSPPLPVRARRFGSMPRVCEPSSNNGGGSSSPNLSGPDGPAGLAQNIMGGSTEPMNLFPANNNPHNVDYGQQQEVLPIPPETNNNVNYGDQYLGNPISDDQPSDGFFNFSDLDGFFDNFASLPQDSTGLFNHVLGSDNMGAGYDNQDMLHLDENANNLGYYGEWNGADANLSG